jgi:hypothetical protein
MNPERAWRRYREAEEAYYDARARLMETDYEPVVRRALNTAAGRGTALRLLADTSSPERLMDWFDALIAVAIRTHPELGLVRQMLASLDPGWLYSNLTPFVEQVISSSESGWEEFRRLAELLDALGQTELLDRVVKAAAAFPDEDTRDVAEDFS